MRDQRLEEFEHLGFSRSLMNDKRQVPGQRKIDLRHECITLETERWTISKEINTRFADAHGTDFIDPGN